MSLVDADRLPDGDVIRGDVCIVGGGPAGITLARSLDHNGLRIVLLEDGGEAFQREIQDLYIGENAGEPYFPLDVTRLRLLGGSTNHWEGYIRALDPPDFEVPLVGSMGAWPFGFAELEDHYVTACQLCEVDDSLDFSGETWAGRAGATLLPTDPDVMSTEVLLRSPPTRFGSRYRDDLIGSDDITLYLNANVVELVEEERRISRVRIAHLEGASQTVEAQVFVLATGGIEVPRLLLASEGAGGPGIGNQHDLVGRFFMEHPHFGGIQLVCEDADGLPFYNAEPQVQGQVIHAIMTIPPELRQALGIGNVAASFMEPGPIARGALADDPLTGSVRSLLRDATGQESPAHLRVQLMAEQVPNALSRIRLSTQRDALGLPRCILDWRLHASDHHTLRAATEVVAGQLALAGVGRVSSAAHGGNMAYSYAGGHHHMGTTRMHDDPARGVVDATGRVHGVDNLYVSSSATFPTGGFANPTLTVVAMALRLATHLTEQGVR